MNCMIFCSQGLFFEMEKIFVELPRHITNLRSDSWLIFFSHENQFNFALRSLIHFEIDKSTKFKIAPSKLGYAISCTRVYNKLPSISLSGAMFRNEEFYRIMV